MNIQDNLAEGNNEQQSQNSTAEGRTFTQDDVNRIVGERLAKEKAKTEQELSQREAELSKRELALKAREIMISRNMPVELLEAVNYTDEKTLNKSLDIIDNYIRDKKSAPKLTGIKPEEGRVIYKPARGDGFTDSSEGIRKAMGLH